MVASPQPFREPTRRCHAVHSYTPTHTRGLGRLGGSEWRRCIGCLTLQVSFCKRATNHRSLCRKMSHQDEASYESWPPCTASTLCNTLQHTATHCNTPNTLQHLYYLTPSSHLIIDLFQSVLSRHHELPEFLDIILVPTTHLPNEGDQQNFRFSRELA